MRLREIGAAVNRWHFCLAASLLAIRWSCSDVVAWWTFFFSCAWSACCLHILVSILACRDALSISKWLSWLALAVAKRVEHSRAILGLVIGVAVSVAKKHRRLVLRTGWEIVMLLIHDCVVVIWLTDRWMLDDGFLAFLLRLTYACIWIAHIGIAAHHDLCWLHLWPTCILDRIGKLAHLSDTHLLGWERASLDRGLRSCVLVACYWGSLHVIWAICKRLRLIKVRNTLLLSCDCLIWQLRMKSARR